MKLMKRMLQLFSDKGKRMKWEATLVWYRLRYLAPVLLAALWLNSIEVALFWSGSFYGFWLAIGWAMHDRREMPNGLETSQRGSVPTTPDERRPKRAR